MASDRDQAVVTVAVAKLVQEHGIEAVVMGLSQTFRALGAVFAPAALDVEGVTGHVPLRLVPAEVAALADLAAGKVSAEVKRT